MGGVIPRERCPDSAGTYPPRGGSTASLTYCCLCAASTQANSLRTQSHYLSRLDANNNGLREPEFIRRRDQFNWFSLLLRPLVDRQSLTIEKEEIHARQRASAVSVLV